MISRHTVKRSAWRMVDRAFAEGDRPRTWWEIVLGIALLAGMLYLFLK